MLDHLLAALVLDVEVDVGRAVALEGEEPLEQQTERDGVGLGDAERVTHRAVRRAPPPLAVDVVDPAELDDLDEHQEVAGEVELLDHVELVGDLVHRLLVVRVRARVADGGAARGELAQPAHLGVPGWNVVIGKLGRGEMQVERARTRDVDGALHRPRPAIEAARLLARAAQVRERRRGEPAVDLVERTARTHRRERGGELALRGSGVVDVVGGDHVDRGGGRDHRQLVVAVTVDRVAVVPQLHEHAIATERGDELVERAARGRGAVAHERRGTVPFRQPVSTNHELFPALGTGSRCTPARAVDGEPGDRGARRALLPRELRLADRPGEPGVSGRPLGEDHEMLALRIGDPVRRALDPQRELGAEHRGQPVLTGGERETDRAVEAVVVGDGQGGEPEPGGFDRQLLRVARAVEKGEIGVAVKFRVGDHPVTVPNICSISQMPTTTSATSPPRAGSPGSRTRSRSGSRPTATRSTCSPVAVTAPTGSGTCAQNRR